MKWLLLAVLIFSNPVLAATAPSADTTPWYLKPWHFVRHQLDVRQVTADLDEIAEALRKIRQQRGSFPQELPAALPLRDPWGTPYRLRLSLLGDGGTAHVTSAGEDRVFGNADDLGIIIE